MLLRQIAEFNDLSPVLRNKIEEKVRGYGKSVRYKFDISHINPDPQKLNGKLLWPNIYVLSPATFFIVDKDEKREGKNKNKRIGLVDVTEVLHGFEKVTKFKKIKVEGKSNGILKLELQEIPEHFEFACYLEIHPKLEGGEFADKTRMPIIKRIDELAAATQARTERSAKQKATNAAQAMSDKELIDFADAMLWDSSQEPEILRNEVELLAETDPVFFNDLVAGKNIEYQALVQQAINKGVILFNPAEYSFVYAGNKQPIITLSPNGEQNEVQKMASWLQTGGQEAYKKIKSLSGTK